MDWEKRLSVGKVLLPRALLLEDASSSPAQVSLGVVECLLGSDLPIVPLFLAQKQLPSTPRLQFPSFILLGIQPDPSFWAGRRFSLVLTPN